MVGYCTVILSRCRTTHHLGCNCYKTIMIRRLWVTRDVPKSLNCSRGSTSGHQ